MKTIKEGFKINMLRVVGEAPRNKRGVRMWNCLCDCGNTVAVRDDYLKSGRNKACGCQQRIHTRTHGMEGTPFYCIWVSMKQRCSNPKNAYYKIYGGRGITVCERWKKFESFRDDLYEDYKKHKAENKYTSLERVDNNKGYTPENCVWATRGQQNRNTRRTISYKGESAVDASRRLGGEKTLVFGRIKKLGWSLEKAFTTPK